MSFCVLTHPIGQNGDNGNVGKVGNISAVGDGSDKG